MFDSTNQKQLAANACLYVFMPQHIFQKKPISSGHLEENGWHWNYLEKIKGIERYTFNIVNFVMK